MAKTTKDTNIQNVKEVKETTKQEVQLDEQFVEKIQTIKELKIAIKSYIDTELKTTNRDNVDTPEERVEYFGLIGLEITDAVNEVIKELTQSINK